MSVDIATPEAGSTTGGLTRDAIFQDGQRFILKERGSGKVLTAIGEDAVLQACDDMSMSVVHSMWHWHWYCAIEEGWVTLRNRVTKNYLGSDSCGGYLIVASRSKTFTGHLVVTRSSGGGQTLSAPYANGIKQIVHDTGGLMLGRSTERNASAKLKLDTTKGLEWEFVRLESQ